MKFEREGYTLTSSEPTVYVDNERRGRSGHMSHALAEFAPGKLIDFNSNCTAAWHGGHSTFGWVEYRISEDGGETFGEVHDLPYSRRALEDGVNVISVEKAVGLPDGRIVAFCLRNDAHELCEPWDVPTVIVSDDGGKSFSEPRELSPYKGRVYDAAYHEGAIYALEFCNDATVNFLGQDETHLYRLYASYDRGESFTEVCVVPIPTYFRGYGSLLFDEAGGMHIYAYNRKDETHMDHVVSYDLGKTFTENTPCYLNEGIRNPQTAILDGVYIAHGRNAERTGFVFYTSLDGQHFDEGFRLGNVEGFCYYSNNVVMKDKEGKNRLLVQYSERYGFEECVNVKHLWLSVEKK